MKVRDGQPFYLSGRDRIRYLLPSNVELKNLEYFLNIPVI